MRIQIISHTIKGNTDKLIGRWSIIPHYFRKQGNEVDHILRNEWSNFFERHNKFNPDVLITAGPIGALIGLMRRIGLVKVPVVHDWNDNYTDVFRGPIKSKIAGFLENFAVKSSDAVITPSIYRLNKGKSLGKIENKTIFYLPHGVKEFFFKHHKPINLPGKNKTKILYVGEVAPFKRIHLLIKELNNKPIDFIVIGNIDQSIKAESADNIHFIGKKPSEEVPRYLKSANFLVLTEDNDSALKLMEYLTTNVPILAPEGRLRLMKRYFPRIIIYDNFKSIEKLLKEKSRVGKDNRKPEIWSNTVKKYISILSRLK